MNAPLRAAGALLALIPAACIFHIDADGVDRESWASDDDLAAARGNNRQAIQQLEVGMTREKVLEVMGSDAVWAGDDVGWINNPFRSESFPTAAEEQIEVLFYYTHAKARDGIVADDELTPVVLRNGQVEGWGDKSYADLR